MTMHVIICYDVKTSDEGGARRLRRIAEACQDYGIRVQFSVFECALSGPDWIVLRNRLLSEYDEDADSLRFYFIDAGDFGQREHHGVRRPIDPSGVLLV